MTLSLQMVEAENLLGLQVHGPSVDISAVRTRLRTIAEDEFEKIFDEVVHACTLILPVSSGQ